MLDIEFDRVKQHMSLPPNFSLGLDLANPPQLRLEIKAYGHHLIG